MESFIAGDSDKLWQWLEDNTTLPHKPDKKPPYKPLPGIKAVVMSGDAMIYGSLVGSRKHHIPQKDLMSRVDRFKAFKQEHPKVPIYVFSSIMRTPRTGEASGSEEPSYYFSYGTDIFRYTSLLDKQEIEPLTKREQKELDFLTELIPQEAISDWYGCGIICDMYCSTGVSISSDKQRDGCGTAENGRIG